MHTADAAPVRPQEGSPSNTQAGDRALVQNLATRAHRLLLVALLCMVALGVVLAIAFKVSASDRSEIFVLRAELSRAHAHNHTLSLQLRHTNALLHKLLVEQQKAAAARALQQEENNAVNSWLTGG